MKSAFERALGVFCIIVLIGLIILGILTFRVNKTVDDTNRWVLHTHDVLFKAEQVLFSVNELEHALEPARSTSLINTPGLSVLKDSLLSKIHYLKYLTRDNSSQQVRIRKLETLVKLRTKRQSVGFNTNVRFQDSLRLASQNLVDQIQKEENELLASRTKANNSSRKALNLLFYSFLLAGLLLLISTYFALKKYFVLQKESELTILKLNQKLEKRVEEKASQLLEKEKQYQLVLDNLLEGAQIIDREWRFMYVNDALTRQARFSVEEMIGAKLTDLFPGIEETELFKHLEKVMTMRVPEKFENTFHYPNGDVAYFELSIEPIMEGLFVLSMDITDRKIKELYKEQYIAELEEVLFKISHEVRSPVVKILGVAQLMELSLIEEKELPMIIDSMKSCALLLDRYTRELSEFVTEMKESSADQ
ncbi:PAS domain-containing protein [Desertivirga arenae]|uniref:PAS domain-containing protein n=1 Tax=Desertivirga arenae TaxID=2810309 RepID=UPI001A9593F8|nr:PAS domain-containing protein [Pedobacter sp. SYSU D00823]